MIETKLREVSRSALTHQLTRDKLLGYRISFCNAPSAGTAEPVNLGSGSVSSVSWILLVMRSVVFQHTTAEVAWLHTKEDTASSVIHLYWKKLLTPSLHRHSHALADQRSGLKKGPTKGPNFQTMKIQPLKNKKLFRKQDLGDNCFFKT